MPGVDQKPAAEKQQKSRGPRGPRGDKAKPADGAAGAAPAKKAGGGRKCRHCSGAHPTKECRKKGEQAAGAAPQQQQQQQGKKSGGDKKGKGPKKEADPEAAARAAAKKAAQEAARKERAEAEAAARAAAAAEKAAAEEAARVAAAEEARIEAERLAAIEAAKPAKQREVEAHVRVFSNTKGETPEARVAALAAVGALCTSAEFRAYEPFLIECALAAVLCVAEDKVADVRKGSLEVMTAFCGKVNPHSVNSVADIVVAHLNVERKWRIKEVALKTLHMLASSELCSSTFGRVLPTVIPVLSEVIWDTKKEVKQAATDVLTDAVKVAGNRDLEPFTPFIVKAMLVLSEVPETIQQLASTTFVQTVDAAALSIIVPLLVRGFKEKTTAIKRQCCVIVTNMSKLVEDAAEAAPFLPELLPALERASDEISDPEARQVAGKSHGHLDRIAKLSDKAIKVNADRRNAAIKAMTEIIGPVVENEEIMLNHLKTVAVSMMKLDSFDEASFKTFVTPYLVAYEADAAKTTEMGAKVIAATLEYMNQEDEDEEDETGEELCNTKFTLAYGSKVLLHNTKIKLMRGSKYGLLGGNESGKTTLLRSISQGQIEGFPSPDEVRTVFVDADIQGEMSHLECLDYVMADPAISSRCTRDEVSKMLLSVDFTEKMLNSGVSTLSGGWRMKLALARAMLQKADILLLDEPTNHLDVLNVKWVEDYLNSLSDVTCIMVSHDSGFLNHCATHIIQIANLKLEIVKGNLEHFVESHPEAKAFFELKSSTQKFTFPQPAFLDGVKSKGKALMKMTAVDFTYPGNDKPTLTDVTVQVSLSSRVACVGVNGAGKSTMIKLLTGQLEPSHGEVWQYPNLRVAYVAQHAFHHIEQHLTRSANEYIRWRYEGGEDKEGLSKASMTITDEEAAKCAEPVTIEHMDVNGNIKKVKKVLERLTGGRRQGKKENEYECKWANTPMDQCSWLGFEKLELMGFTKHMKIVDVKIEAREGMYARALTQDNVEKHLEDVGLDREFGTHNRMAALSGGQKVKVVIGAAMWNQPQILILDEPTNYLDRESLGALAEAIREYQGGVVMVTHNNEFCSALCPETWVVEHGKCDCRGDPEWMKSALKSAVEFRQLEEMVDGNGNTVKVKKAKKKLTRKERLARQKRRAFAKANGEEVSDSEDDL